MDKNVLFYGDNLDVITRHIADESIDLVYLDPPFKSNADYNVLFGQHGARPPAQIQAFEDTWIWDTVAAATYQGVVEKGGPVATTLRSFRSTLGDSDMLAYLSMMAPRLVELRRVLRHSGTLYLHCDTTASHYLKLLLDSVFSPERFTNEIVWRRYGAHNDVGQGSRHFGRVHDVLLVYAKSDKPKWHQLFTPLESNYVLQTYRYVEQETGRRFRVGPVTGPGGAAKGNPVYEWRGHTRAWRFSKEKMAQLDAEGKLYYSKTGYVGQKQYLDESRGVPVQDLWTDIPSLSGAHKERLGYPTQKPEALLERVIEASTDPGDVVLDPFCGCGTAIAVAERLGRRWIGIDITSLAINLIKNRLEDRYGSAVADTYRVVGEPTTEDEAAVLARQDPFQFQAWALGLVGARPGTTVKKGGDRGIDGELYFHDEPGGRTKRILISVKAGKVLPTHLRDLAGTLAREEADLGVLLTFQAPSPAVRGEAASAGYYTSPLTERRHPRLQVLTVGQVLEGAQIDYPRYTGANVTLRRADRHKAAADNLELFRTREADAE